ncbi:MAG: Rrf2 family transcriptional regulator [bacterium]
MKFSTRSTYGLRALIQIAIHQNGLLSVAQIAKTENLSSDYLERLVSRLKKAGIITASKGSNGGYELAKTAQEITLYEVLEALEGSKSLFSCAASGGQSVECSSNCHCASDTILGYIEIRLNQTLKSLTLEDLIKKQK